MKKILVAGLAAAGVLAGGTGAVALVNGGGATPASATTVAATYITTDMPCAGALSSLVRKGTITRAQATAIQNALWAYMRDHSARMGEHMAGSRGHLGDMDDMWGNGPMARVLQELVSKGTITKAQATAITSTITQRMTAWHDHGAGMMGSHDAGMMGGGHIG